ncbi:MAG: DUF368 domain-containing protein [Proteobacteria bacterium]|nr:DUF368 domain-containing protein [Pseudomonadota bacterium]
MQNPAENNISDAAQTKTTLGVMFRGGCMGLAELVPGISGGTIAFVTGIYAELVGTLAQFGPRSITLLGQPKVFWRHHNLGFLCALVGGMGIGILALAPVVRFLLANAAPMLWAFFFGLIWASVIFIGRSRSQVALLKFGSLGLLLGMGFLMLPTGQIESSWLTLFFAGAIAVCAWILPAVSGSFVLLLLGLYDDVIIAISELNLFLLSAVALGCASGLALFVRALSWLLRHHEDRLLSLLTGFMAVALAKLWPWQNVEAQSFSEGLLWPADYAALTGQSDYLMWVGPALVLGFFALWLLQRVTRPA